MIDALRSEFRKLISIRSAYFLAAVIMSLIALVVTFSAYESISSEGAVDQGFMAGNISSTILMTAQVCAIFAALFMSHEYRYNLIYHTLTTLRSRAMAILTKVVVVSAYSLIVSLAVILVAVASAYFGSFLAGGEIPAQDLPVLSLLSRGVFYTLGFTLAGLLFAVWFRNVVLPVALLILLPNTVEPIASVLLGLGEKADYLPFTSLQQIMVDSTATSVWVLVSVFSLYLVTGWVVGWILFKRRDANV